MDVGGTQKASEPIREPTSAWPQLQMLFGEVGSLPTPACLAGYLWDHAFLEEMRFLLLCENFSLYEDKQTPSD